MSFITDSTLGIVIDLVFIAVFSAYLYWVWGLFRALKSDAPYVPMSEAVVRSLVAHLTIPSGSTWIDLGSGDGRVLIEAARRYGIRGIGIERIGALRVWSRIKIRMARVKNIQIRSGDFFDEDLSQYDVVSFYLLPVTAERLFPKLQHNMKSGALLGFHRYPLPGLELVHHDIERKIYVAQAPLVRNVVREDESHSPTLTS